MTLNPSPAPTEPRISGDPEALHALGRLTPSERFALLLDPGSLRAAGSYAAWGRVQGRKALVLGGAGDGLEALTALWGEATAEGAVIVELLDAPRGQGLEALDALIAARLAARGKAFVISVLCGDAIGPEALLPGLADLVVMSGAGGYLSLGGAALAQSLFGEDEPEAAYGSPAFHDETTGLAGFHAANEARLLLELRRLIGLTAPSAPAPERPAEAFLTALPGDPLSGWSAEALLPLVVDAGDSFALWSGYGQGLQAAIARIGGQPVGVLVSHPDHRGGTLDHRASRKARRFAQLLQRLGLPLVLLLDSPGSLPGLEEESSFALAEAVALRAELAALPTAALVLRRAQGAAALAFGLGNPAQPLLAWPGARIMLEGGLEAASSLPAHASLIDPRRSRPELIAALAAARSRAQPVTR